MADYLDDPHWLTGGNSDPGISYCKRCAERVRADYGPECVIDGGWPVEDDTPPQCDECHIPLAATMLDDSGTEIETREDWADYVVKLDAA